MPSPNQVKRSELQNLPRGGSCLGTTQHYCSYWVKHHDLVVLTSSHWLWHHLYFGFFRVQRLMQLGCSVISLEEQEKEEGEGGKNRLPREVETLKVRWD